jgi:ABC-type branched-chain amino acid transport systems, ATPase component
MSDSSLETIPTIDDALFSARDIETGYGELQVLYGVDIDIRQNEIVLVFGPNGAGKSTLIKALYQRLPLWGGEVEIDGSDLSDVNSNQMIEHGIGFVPQTKMCFRISPLQRILISGQYMLPTLNRDERRYWNYSHD